MKVHPHLASICLIVAGAQSANVQLISQKHNRQIRGIQVDPLITYVQWRRCLYDIWVKLRDSLWNEKVFQKQEGKTIIHFHLPLSDETYELCEQYWRLWQQMPQMTQTMIFNPSS